MKKNLTIALVFGLFFLFCFFLYILRSNQNPIELSYCQSDALGIDFRVDDKFEIMQFEILDNKGNHIDGGKLLLHDSIGTIELSLETEYNFYTIRVKDPSNNAATVSSNVHIADEFNCNELYLDTNNTDSIGVRFNNYILNLRFLEEW